MHVCFAPVGATAQAYVKAAGIRWTVETCFRESKSEAGLDQYETRVYNWHRHITFACLALALLAALSAQSFDKKTSNSITRRHQL